jgi:tape measure domain-containing protein
MALRELTAEINFGGNAIQQILKLEKSLDDLKKSILGTQTEVKDTTTEFTTLGTKSQAAMLGKTKPSVEKTNKEIIQAEKNTAKWNKALSGIGASGIIYGFTRVAGSVLNAGIQFEQTKLSFEVMLGGATKAEEMLAKLDKFSLATPFEPEQVIKAGKQLIAFGADAATIEGTLKRVGDVASGSGKDFNELASIYGKSMAAGKVQAMELNQLSDAGIPILDELAKMFNVEKKAIFEMGSKSQITFQHLETAFDNMSAAGGRYEDMMARQSKTAGGLLSTFKGFTGTLIRSFGLESVNVLKPLIQVMVDLAGKVNEFFNPNTEEGINRIRVAITLLAPIIGTVLVGAFYAAATAAWAFIAPLLPIIGIALAIGAAIGFLILVGEDLYHFFTGGESLIGNFLNWIDSLLDSLGILGDIIRWVGYGIGIFAALLFWPITVIYLLVKGIIWLVRNFDFLWLSIKNVFSKGINFIIDLAKTYGPIIITTLFPLAGLFFYWDEIKEGFWALVDSIVDIAGEVGDAISKVFSLDFIKEVWDDVQNYFLLGIEYVENLFLDFGKSIEKIFDGIVGSFKEAFEWLGLIETKTAGAASIEVQRRIVTTEATSPILPRQHGGPVFTGQSYIVGEKGPEIFTPNNAGNITSNEKIGGNSNVINVNFGDININLEESDELTDTLVSKVKDALDEISEYEWRAETGLLEPVPAF